MAWRLRLSTFANRTWPRRSASYSLLKPTSERNISRHVQSVGRVTASSGLVRDVGETIVAMVRNCYFFACEIEDGERLIERGGREVLFLECDGLFIFRED